MARRQVGGWRARPWGIEAYVKVRDQQFQKTFPLGTDEGEIQEWCLRTQREAKKGSSAKGTLAHDIDRFLATMSGRRQVDFEIWLKKWKAALGARTRVTIDRGDAMAQFEKWQAEGYSASSLNHLRTVAISLWKWCDGKFHRCPVLEIDRFTENNTRQGFFERDEFAAIKGQLASDYADLAEFLYHSGWRHAEGRELTWSEIDLAGAVIRLSPERSKNGEGRVLPLTGAIKTVIDRRLALKCELPYVFHYQRSKKGPRQPIGNWRKAWNAACDAAGFKGKLIHDFRRTVVRNLTRAGAPEKVAMAWTGHKTRAVFDRYNIVNEKDLRQAGDRLQEYLDGKPE
jgi:integrase